MRQSATQIATYKFGRKFEEDEAQLPTFRILVVAYGVIQCAQLLGKHSCILPWFHTGNNIAVLI